MIITVGAHNPFAYPFDGNTASVFGSTESISFNKNRILYFVCEPIIIALIVFPLVVLFWQSGWNFIVEWLGTSLGQHPAVLPSLYLLCQFILFAIYTNQDRLYTFLLKYETKSISTIILQIYSLFTALNYIVQWVSMWTIWDSYTSDDWLLMLMISLIAMLTVIVLTGHSYDLVCAPFIISYDSIKYNIRIETPFITGKMSPFLSHLLNYIFYEHIISLLCILVWRGWYNLLDVFMYPNDENWSAGLSLIVGYILFFILMYTQSFHNYICILSTFIYLNFPSLMADLRHLCAFFSCLFLWRGYWIYFDTHIATLTIVQQAPYIAYLIGMAASFFILTLMKTASSINGPMSHIKDEQNLFPLYSNCYLSKLFNHNKQSDDNLSHSSKITFVETLTITSF